MKFIRRFKHSPDIVIALLTGLIALATAKLPQLALLRVLFGFLFVFLGSGYSLTRLLPQGASIPQRIIVAAMGSLLLLYPAAVFTVLYEGQSPQAIFGIHLTHSLFALLILSSLLTAFVLTRHVNKIKPDAFPVVLVLPLALYGLVTFWNLNRADVFGDEYDLGYQAYNLVDGIRAGRQALTISFSGHPSLAMDIKHFSMNILEPNGLDRLQDWQFRVSEGMVAILTIIVAYVLGAEIFSNRVGLITALLLSVNNYMIWMGRIYHREMYLTFFMTAAVFFYLIAKRRKERIYWLLSGLAFGGSLLVKETGLLLCIIPISDLIFSAQNRKKALWICLIALVMFLPVIAFNIAAFFKTGYADVFFSNLLGDLRPGATPIHTTPILNLYSILSYLLDIYSPLIFEVFVVGLSLSVMAKRMNGTLLLWLGASIVFFAVTSIRAYYFLFFTVPLVMTASDILNSVPKTMRNVIFALIVGYSLFYAVNTNLARGFSAADSIGRVDGSLIVKRTLAQQYSSSVRSWSEEVGYKRLQQVLDKTIRPGDCLLVSFEMEPLAVRRYLGINDQVKEHYLGKNYPSRYPNCPGDPNRVEGTVYMVSENQYQPGSLFMTVTDHLGNDRFYLFRKSVGQTEKVLAVKQ